MNGYRASFPLHPLGWKWALIAITLFLLGISSCLHAATPLTNLPPHPRLLLNSSGLTALKQRIAREDWARASWNALKAEVDRSLSLPIVLPPRGGNWSHHYVCPAHGARLSQGKQLDTWRWEHLCPAGNHRLQGDSTQASLDFDGNAISGVHSSLAQQLVNLGLVFHVTGDALYARKARDILLSYAEQYLKYPLHDNQGQPGQGARVASQSLSEATWLIEIAQGADLIWNTLTDAQQKTVAEKLLRPALQEVILPRRLGIHNIQCRHNSAIGLVGFLLGDHKLLATAIDDPQTGFHRQLAEGVLDDGMWFEGSSGYHFFTIAGLWPLMEAARNCGIDLYSEKFRSMFLGPLQLAMPDFVLPNFNDSGLVSLKNQADHYELAFARYQDPKFVPLLSTSNRRGRLALLYGLSPSRGADAIGSLTSRNLKASDYAILQAGTDQRASWLCLKYGPHGGGHGHPDKNNFILYARGQILATDAGTHAYGSALHRSWDKTSLAHNTLIVDEQSQERSTGACLAFGTERGVDYAIADAGPIYDDLRFIRTTAMLTPDLVIFVDQVQANAAHQLDVAYHQLGKWDLPADIAPGQQPWMPPNAPGYTHITQATTRTLAKGENLTLPAIVGSTWKSAITVAAAQPLQLIKGYGILKTTEDLVPLLLQRQSGQRAVFVWAISIDGTPVRLELLPVAEPSGKPLDVSAATAVRVTGKAGHWTVLTNPDGKTVTLELGTNARVQTEAFFKLY